MWNIPAQSVEQQIINRFTGLAKARMMDFTLAYPVGGNGQNRTEEREWKKKRGKEGRNENRENGKRFKVTNF